MYGKEFIESSIWSDQITVEPDEAQNIQNLIRKYDKKSNDKNQSFSQLIPKKVNPKKKI